MNYLLALDVSVNDSLSVSEALGFGGQVVLLGMLTVFAVLVILWFSLSLFKFFFADLRLGEKLERPKEITTAPVVEAPVYTATDEEIVAVIAAAIAAAESEAPTGVKFRVVSFKRK